MAMANQRQVEEFADKLSECADSIHIRLMKAIKNKEIDQYTAQLIFQDEATLRQRANSLYIDASNCVVDGLSASQKSMVGLIDTAKDKIKTIKKIAGFMDFIADLLVLVAAAYAAKPEPILAALEEVRKDLEDLNKR